MNKESYLDFFFLPPLKM